MNLSFLLILLLIPSLGFAAKRDTDESQSSTEVTLGAGNFKSTYSRDEGILFDARPRGPWEYMATGTGRTGVAVITDDQLLLQINHEGAMDERGWLRAPGRLHFTFGGDPLSAAAKAGRFRMRHDLRHSRICLSANTNEGPFQVEIRANMQEDVVRVDVQDDRQEPQPFTLALDIDWPVTGRDSSQAGTIRLWHDNGDATDWHEVNVAGGLKNDADLADPLKNRSFGIGIRVDPGVQWSGNRIELPGQKHTTLHIAAAAAIGRQRLLGVFQERLDSPHDKAAFVSSHEAWWNDYWNRVWFESDGSMSRHLAAYDLYRYFSAAISRRDREFPERFQIALLRSHLRRNDWTEMQINSVQTIEAYWPMLKNGDWDQLAPLLSFYARTQPVYRQQCRDVFRHEGLFIPYTHNPWGGPHYYRVEESSGNVPRPRVGDKEIAAFSTNQWARYSFEHGMALMQMAMRAADASGDKRLAHDVVIPISKGLCEFFVNHYRKEKGKLVLDPATSGETWYEVRNPTSWILLFRSFLPALAALGEQHHDERLTALAGELLASLPDLPRGNWRSGQDVLLPAEVFDRHEPINHENPELYGIWPYGNFGVGLPDYPLALRSYNNRLWKNGRDGWNLDVIWAARLGLTDELLRDYDEIHFPATVRCPGGFSYEGSPAWPEEPSLPLYPSMQGMGASVCHLYEMVCQDRSDGILILPAWPRDKPLRMAMYSAVAGRVEIEYTSGQPPRVTTQRPVAVQVAK